MDIQRVTRIAAVQAAGHLFDAVPARETIERFLADEGRHILIAYVNGVPAGVATGVETPHPDQGTEMFLYELGVDNRYKSRGVGRALVLALARLARERGCRGLWTATGESDRPAPATYESVGGTS